MSSAIRSRANTFAGFKLERDAERRDDEFLIGGHLADRRARFLVMAQARALVQPGGLALHLLSADERRAWAAAVAPSYLGSDDGGPYFLLDVDAVQAAAITAASAGEWLDLRSAGVRLHPFQSGLFAYASGLASWQARTRFCPACGARLLLIAAGHRAHCSNPGCALDHFPRIDPAIIVIVSHGDSCLLGRQPSWPNGRYSTLAGFVEQGESLEDAVQREVFEEAGVRVVDCDYHSSQPWPFPASLMLGFTARADDPSIHIGPELHDARWFSVDALVRALGERELSLSPPLSVSYRLIEHWLRETAGLELGQLTESVP